MIGSSNKAMYLLLIALLNIAALTACESIDGYHATDSDDNLNHAVEFAITVVDKNTDKPIVNAEVKLADNISYTNSDGTATFKDIEIGTYKLEITADDYIIYSSDNIIIINSPQTRNVSMAPTDPGKYISAYEMEILQTELALLTEKEDLEGVIALLNTPEKIVEYMCRNCEHYFEKYGSVPDKIYPQAPEDFFQNRVGNCQDFAAFISYVMDQHGHDVFILYFIGKFDEARQNYDDIYGHTVAVFEDINGQLFYFTQDGGPQWLEDKDLLRYASHNNRFSIYGPFNNLEAIFENEEVRLQGSNFVKAYKHRGSIGEKIQADSFEGLIEKLDDPVKLLNYIARNFSYDTASDQTQLKAPQQTFEEKMGNRKDLAIFVSYILDYHGFETYILKYQVSENGEPSWYDIRVVYWEENKVRYIVDNLEQIMRESLDYKSLEALLNDIERADDIRNENTIEIIRYGLIEPGATDFNQISWFGFDYN